MEIFGVTLPTWLVVTLVTCYLLYRYMTRDFDYFTKQGIRGPPPRPVFGTMIGLLKEGVLKFDLELCKKYGKVVGCFDGSTPSLLVYDPEMTKQILVKHFNAFQNRQDFDFAEYPLDKSLNFLRDDHWKHVRSLLTPTFSGSKLRKMTHQLYKSAVNMRNTLKEAYDKGQSFDIRSVSGNFTMDAIAATAFGIELDCQKDPNNKFVTMAKKSFAQDIKDPRIMIMVFAPKAAKYLSKLGMSFFPSEVTAFFTEITNNIIKHREQHPEIQVKDFLELMLRLHVDDKEVKDLRNSSDLKTSGDFVSGERGFWSQSKLTHGEILAQSLMFFIAGYETTAVTMSYLAYNLAMFPDKQDKLLDEIDRLMEGKDEVDYDTCKRMEYLSMCLDETLRMYPAGARVMREAGRDITIEGVKIRKGMVISCSVYGMHHDPDLWPDPETFIPERFTAEAKASREPYCFLPFGHGPRNCIGMRLALLEIKIAFVTVLKYFKFVTCDETEIPVQTATISVSPLNGIKLKLQSRK